MLEPAALKVCYFGLKPRTILECAIPVCVGFPHVGINFVNRIATDCQCWNFTTLTILKDVVSEPRDRVYIRIPYTGFFHGLKAGCFRFGVFIKHLIYIRKYKECIPWFTLRMLRTFTWQFYNIDWIQDTFENVWLYFNRKPVCILPGYQKFTIKLQACEMSLSNLYCSVQKWNNNARIPSNLKTRFVTTFQYFQYFDLYLDEK